MKTLFATLMLAVAALLAGCGTSAAVQRNYRLTSEERLKLEIVHSKAAGAGGFNAETVARFKNHLASQLASSDLLASGKHGKTRLLEVNVTSYRMRSDGARFWAGIMAGKDGIQSTVSIKDMASGRTLMQFTVESSNSTAWGSSQGMIEDHANQIVETLAKTRDGPTRAGE